MSKKAIVLIESQNAFIREFEEKLSIIIRTDPINIIQLDPQFNREDIAESVDRCVIRLEDIIEKDNLDVEAVFVDLSVGDTSPDKLGIDIGMGIRKKYPELPIFCMTNKNNLDNNYDGLFEASLKDFDGVFAKSFLTGKDSSAARIKKIVVDGKAKRNNVKDRISSIFENEVVKIKCDVAIITALHEEIEPVKSLIDIDEVLSKSIGSQSTKIGKLKKSNLTVVIDYQAKMGLVDAAILATNIMSNYSPKLLVMTGVCGGRAVKGIEIGTIVTPYEIFDYQTGKFENKEFKTYNYSSQISEDLIKKVKEWKSDILSEMVQNCISSEGDKARMSLVKVNTDVIASGSWVLKTEGYLDYISDTFNDKTVAVEMESYAVARACNLLPFKNLTEAIVIKASMDNADKLKNDRDKDWASLVSSQFAFYFIKKLEEEGYFEKKVNGDPI